MYVGTLSVEILLGDVRSLKEKRGVVRPIVAEVARKFAVSVAEVGHLDLHRRCRLGIAVVAGDAAHCRDVLTACDRLIASRPEIDVLESHLDVRKEDE